MIAARRSADFPARFEAGLASGSLAEITLGILAEAARVADRRFAGWVRVDVFMRSVMVKI